MNKDRALNQWLRIGVLGLVLAALAVFAFAAPGLRAAGRECGRQWRLRSWRRRLDVQDLLGRHRRAGPDGRGRPGDHPTEDGPRPILPGRHHPSAQHHLRVQLFWGRSNSGANVQVTLLGQNSPFPNYGIAPKNFDLTANGQEFTYTFTHHRLQPAG